MRLLFFVMLMITIVPLSAMIEINSLEDLQKIGVDPTFPLTESYTLSGDIDASVTVEQNGGEGFSPLASGWGNEFTGIFDGAGYSIKGLYINRPTLNIVGLFGYIGEGGVVKNLKLTEASVHGMERTGIIAGYNKGTIENCEVSGKVSSEKDNTGGIAGVNGGVTGKRTGRIFRCVATVDVQGGRNHTGGIAGWCYMGNAEECAVFGTVSGQTRVAGIFGACNGGIITRSFSLASISADSVAAGLVAWCNTEYAKVASHVSESWAGGKVTASKGAGGAIGWLSANAPVEKVYWDKERTGQTYSAGSEDNFGLTTDGMLSSASYIDWDFPTVWSNRDGVSYPALAWMDFPFHTVIYTATDGGSLTGTLEQELNMLSVGESVTAEASEGYHFIRWDDRLYKESRRDAGIVSDTTFMAVFAEPVAISSFAEFEKIGSDSDYPMDYHYYFTADINGNDADLTTLGGDSLFRGSLDGKEFTLGNMSVTGPLFYSIASGAAISNLNIENITSTAPEGYGGILAGVNKGVLSNITIENSHITSNKNVVGGLVGLNSRGTVKLCIASATVMCDELAAGGLVGFNYHGTVTQSGAHGSVTAQKHAGGLVGYFHGGTISESYATGNVLSQEWAAGGAIGIMIDGIVENCYARGDVEGGDTARDIGGFIGRLNNGSGERCYSTGKVTSRVDDAFGGFIGFAKEGYIDFALWDTLSSGINHSDFGMGLSTDDMSQAQTYDGWDFATVWEIPERGGYAQLQWQAAGPQVSIQKATTTSFVKSAHIAQLNNNRLSLTIPSGIKGVVSLFRVNGQHLFQKDIKESGVITLPKFGTGIFLVKLVTPKENIVKTMILR